MYKCLLFLVSFTLITSCSEKNSKEHDKKENPKNDQIEEESYIPKSEKDSVLYKYYQFEKDFYELEENYKPEWGKNIQAEFNDSIDFLIVEKNNEISQIVLNKELKSLTYVNLCQLNNLIVDVISSKTEEDLSLIKERFLNPSRSPTTATLCKSFNSNYMFVVNDRVYFDTDMLMFYKSLFTGKYYEIRLNSAKIENFRKKRSEYKFYNQKQTDFLMNTINEKNEFSNYDDLYVIINGGTRKLGKSFVRVFGKKNDSFFILGFTIKFINRPGNESKLLAKQKLDKYYSLIK